MSTYRTSKNMQGIEGIIIISENLHCLLPVAVAVAPAPKPAPVNNLDTEAEEEEEEGSDPNGNEDMKSQPQALPRPRRHVWISMLSTRSTPRPSKLRQKERRKKR